LCIIGIVGYILDNTILSAGITLGGIAFLISLIFMILDFGKRTEVNKS